ncbi:uncharacterized mitochondrial protein AtMg00810-like [Miscanthus floridulus]|uniref:uncharacterized mitochondrial protein AtMg00810-like n=1 Tax=Miscanthus floridulus TaxID=154761 RepID=UPI003457D76F
MLIEFASPPSDIIEFMDAFHKEMIFVRQPLGFAIKGEEHRVLRLHNALYRLRQAPRAWNAKLDATLGELRFQSIEVRQGKEELTLDQSVYASKLLERSDMTECKPCVTPMEERLKLTKANTAAKVDATVYRSIIGGLHYLVHMRPDIAFAVGYFSPFMEDPREDH